jgi:putative ABC transport system substrate-binding protein
MVIKATRRKFVIGLGSAVAWRAPARAQKPAMPTIGYLNWSNEARTHTVQGMAQLAAFRRGLAESGYVEGMSVAILYRWAEFRRDRLASIIEEFKSRKVDVIATTAGIVPALAAKAATSTIPIVFQMGADPIEFGLVSSLSRPGRNITGATFLTQALVAKRLEALHEAAPAATVIGYLINPTSPQTAVTLREAENAARALGIRLVILNASMPSDIEAAFVALDARQVGAICVDTEPLFTAYGSEIAALAVRHSVPTIFGFREAVEAGGLMSYGSDVTDAYGLVGNYAGRILKGEKPGDLPVQQSAKIALVINLKTAKELGLTFPITLRGRADEVLE